MMKTIFLIVILTAIYHICFPLFIPSNSPPPNMPGAKADLVVVFPGGENRRYAGYQLVQNGYADSLVITSGADNLDAHYSAISAVNGPLKYLFVGRARSTFEDALFTKELTAQRNVTSLILVTDDYHLPRASFLLHALLADRPMTIYTVAVHPKAEHSGRTRACITQFQLLLDERVKFLGSLMEMGIYRITGILINDYDWLQQLKTHIKNLVLFNVTGAK